MLVSWMSQQSLETAARMGLGMFFTTLKDPLEYEPEITTFNGIRAELGQEPLRPSVFVCTYCAETEEEAWRGAREYMGNWNAMGAVHYGLNDVSHFEKAGGYEWWAEMARGVASTDIETIKDVFAQSQLWGTPEQCIQKIRRIQEALDPDNLVLVFRLAGMTYEQTKASMELFAREVLPAVRQPLATGVR
jgi:alkanesulfonate monooxygenase SsuD/methylene tetrahydromethanopterin reductase-like flavin-dependent oxidoreductase (luciferase family)